MKTNPLDYNKEMQDAAVAAFTDSTGSDFWAEVAKLQAEQPAAEGLVQPRQTRETQ